jgi:hypothetical protein
MNTNKQILESLRERREDAIIGNERHILQSLNEGEILEMARIGYIPMGTKELEVYVNTDDSGKIPHFHVRNKDWSFHTCIEFKKPDYFHHEGKTDVLNRSQKKELIKFFKAKAVAGRTRGKSITNWDLACIDWNRNNSDVILPEGQKMPDYAKL